MAPNFFSQAERLLPEMIARRRDFHRHPELGFQEFRTAGIVAPELNRLGLEVTTGVGKTGVVGLLEGERPGPVVLLRFDMDALPIHEANTADYASQTAGVMHACGHDGHTAIGLAVAQMLAPLRPQLTGALKFVFQLAEEGLGGADPPTPFRGQGVAEGVAQALGCEAQVDLKMIAPAIVNDAAMAARVRALARTLPGVTHVADNERTMGSEDMAFMMQTIPGCYFFVGSNNVEKGLNFPHHHPRFDFDERALAIGAALMAHAAAEYVLGA